MIVRHLLKWVETARVSDRAAAANALARAYVSSDLLFEDRCAAEAALTLLLDDPSPIVRAAMAEPLSLSRRAPPQVVHALAADQPDVAAVILVRSPLLTDADLIDHVATGGKAAQKLIAMRPAVSMAVSAAIAEIGEPVACRELLANGGAEVASLSFRRMAERHGHLAELRELMLNDWRVPADTRYMLLVKLGDALTNSPLVQAFVGKARAERVTRDACLKASLTLIDGTAPQEHAALVEHLRLRGDLTAGFIIRAVASGKIDFFGAVIVALTGQDPTRVRALLVGGRDTAICALLRSAGLADATHGVIVAALKVWRDVANGKRVAGPQEVTWLMLTTICAAPGQDGPVEEHCSTAGLLKSIHLDALRENARSHALAIAAA
jgi:uncharacterized protein (DUF2336 family)